MFLVHSLNYLLISVFQSYNQLSSVDFTSADLYDFTKIEKHSNDDNFALKININWSHNFMMYIFMILS